MKKQGINLNETKIINSVRNIYLKGGRYNPEEIEAFFKYHCYMCLKKHDSKSARYIIDLHNKAMLMYWKQEILSDITRKLIDVEPEQFLELCMDIETKLYSRGIILHEEYKVYPKPFEQIINAESLISNGVLGDYLRNK